MEKFFKRYNTKNMNKDQIDDVSFYESLLACAPTISAACKEIDKQITKIATTPYLPEFDIDTKEQFDAVIDLIDIKIDLLKINELYQKWFKALDDKRKQFVETYFIKKNAELLRKMAKNGHYYTRHIIPVIASFRCYLKLMFDLSELDLISNPIIYETYVKTYDKNLRRRKKEKNKYDD